MVSGSSPSVARQASPVGASCVPALYFPHAGTNGFRFTVIMPRITGYSDVVLRLLERYRPEANLDAEEDEYDSSDLFGDLGDDPWSTGEALEESNGLW
jgi:hypothetical protein